MQIMRCEANSGGIGAFYGNNILEIFLVENRRAGVVWVSAVDLLLVVVWYALVHLPAASSWMEDRVPHPKSVCSTIKWTLGRPSRSSSSSDGKKNQSNLVHLLLLADPSLRRIGFRFAASSMPAPLSRPSLSDCVFAGRAEIKDDPTESPNPAQLFSKVTCMSVRKKQDYTLVTLQCRSNDCHIIQCFWPDANYEGFGGVFTRLWLRRAQPQTWAQEGKARNW